MNGYKMQTAYLLVVSAMVVQHIFAQIFPGFIQKCKVSDPKFDDCVLNSANNFVSTFAKGDDKYGIAPVTLSPNSTAVYTFPDKFVLKLTNLTTNLYENLALTNVRFDFEKKLLVFEAKSTSLQYSGKYEAGGQILGKPVNESGKFNVTFDYIQFNAIVRLDFKMKNEKKYIEAVSCALLVHIKNFRFKPYNQIIVGEPMTVEQKQIFQSHIDKLSKRFKRGKEKYDKGFMEILNTIFEMLPFEDIFIP